MKLFYKKKSLAAVFLLFTTLFSGCSSLNEKPIKEPRVTFITEKGEKKNFPFINQQFSVEKSEKFIVANTAFIVEDGDTWYWEYGIITADGKKLEYVKAELVGADFSLKITYDDKTPKKFTGENSTNWINLGENGKGKLSKKVHVFKDGQNLKAMEYNIWEGRSKPSKEANPANIWAYDYHKYLIKFTIKNKNEEPEIIYQPCVFPVTVKGEQGAL